MAKLVVLSKGMTGQSYELKVDKTTVGRVEDNTFQIPEASVSSHHCEILLRGNDIVVKDLNSTNGTFINNTPVTTEAVLKPDQVLRLGEVEIRLEVGGTTSSAPAGAPPATPGKRATPPDSTMVVNRGVKLDEFNNSPQSLDTKNTTFTKKTNKTNKWFILVGIVLTVVIVVAFIMVFSTLNNHPPAH